MGGGVGDVGVGVGDVAIMLMMVMRRPNKVTLVMMRTRMNNRVWNIISTQWINPLPSCALFLLCLYSQLHTGEKALNCTATHSAQCTVHSGESIQLHSGEKALLGIDWSGNNWRVAYYV